MTGVHSRCRPGLRSQGRDLALIEEGSPPGLEVGLGTDTVAQTPW
jgi:hypothetical protein